MKKKGVMRAEKKSNFSIKNSSAEAEFRYRKGVGRNAELGYSKRVKRKGKTQKWIKGKKQRDKVRRCPDLLKSSAKLNFLGRSNSSASLKSFIEWNEVGKQTGLDFIFASWNYRACKRWGCSLDRVSKNILTQPSLPNSSSSPLRQYELVGPSLGEKSNCFFGPIHPWDQ